MLIHVLGYQCQRGSLLLCFRIPVVGCTYDCGNASAVLCTLLRTALLLQWPIRSDSDMYYVPDWKRDAPPFDSHAPRVLIAPLAQTSRMLLRRGQAENVHTIVITAALTWYRGTIASAGVAR